MTVIWLFGTRLFGTGTNIDAYRWPHDAWNRLVGVEYGQTVRGAYVYSGLNRRIMKQADTDGTSGPATSIAKSNRRCLAGA
jgi:hypothetical protein